MARAHAEWELQRQHDLDQAIVVFVVLGVLAVLALLFVAVHKRKIAKAADAALVAGLATGVRAARTVASRKAALKARVLAAADKPASPQD